MKKFWIYFFLILFLITILVAIRFGAEKVWQKQLDRYSLQDRKNWERHKKTFGDEKDLGKDLKKCGEIYYPHLY